MDVAGLFIRDEVPVGAADGFAATPFGTQIAHDRTHFANGFIAQNLEHDSAAGRALAFDRFTAVLHRFFDAVGDLFLGLALDAISFSHKNFTVQASCPNGEGSLTEQNLKRNL